MFSKRDRVLRGVLKQRFAVTFTSGAMVSGLLLDVDDSVLRFADVRIIQGSGETPANGELYVDRVHVSYMQHVTAKE